jgi:hypothetical protein
MEMRKENSHASWAHGVRAQGERERRAAGCRFAVHGVTAKGTPYKQEMSVHETAEAADVKREYYERVNPGRKFVTVSR